LRTGQRRSALLMMNLRLSPVPSDLSTSNFLPAIRSFFEPSEGDAPRDALCWRGYGISALIGFTRWERDAFWGMSC
jgi:hypothetical protein